MCFSLSGKRTDESQMTSSGVQPCLRSNRMDEALSSHHYKSYVVTMLHRLRGKTDVQIGTWGPTSLPPSVFPSLPPSVLPSLPPSMLHGALPLQQTASSFSSLCSGFESLLQCSSSLLNPLSNVVQLLDDSLCEVKVSFNWPRWPPQTFSEEEEEDIVCYSRETCFLCHVLLQSYSNSSLVG